MHPRVATAAIKNLTYTTSFVIRRGSIEHLYWGYLDYAGFFTVAGTTCTFEEHDPEILNYPELFTIKVTLSQ
jgi:hypothetical protein